MPDVGIDLHFNDNKLVSEWQQQINLSKQLVENVQQLQTQLNGATNKLSTQLDGLNKNTQKANTSMGGMFSTLKGLAAFAGINILVSKMKELGTYAVTTSAKFEQFRTTLTNSLGSKSEAEAAMKRIQDFASKTPFGVEELTSAFVQLANRGIKPSTETLTAMGDLASALGKPLQQVNEAVLDVTNSERWTELGIKVKVNGDKITGTFRGMTVTADKTEQGALDLVEAFGRMEGVSGGMAAQAQTLNGQISNLKDSFQKLAGEMGDKAAPALKEVVANMIEFIESIDIDKLFLFFTTIKDSIVPALEELYETLKDVTGGLVSFDSEKLATGILTIVDAVTLLVRGIDFLIEKNPAIKFLLTTIGKVADGLGLVIQDIAAATGGSAVDSYRQGLAALRKETELREDAENALINTTNAAKTAIYNTLLAQGLSAKEATKLLKDYGKKTKDNTKSTDDQTKAVERLDKALQSLYNEIEKKSIGAETDPRKKAELEYQAELKRIDTLRIEIEKIAAQAGRKANIGQQILDLQNYAEIEYQKALSIIKINELKLKGEEAKAKQDAENDSLERLQAADDKEQKEKDKLAKEDQDKELKRIDEGFKLAQAHEEQLQVIQKNDIQKAIDSKSITKEAGELKLLELERKFHLRRIELYIQQREDEAKAKGEKFDPATDAGLIGLKTETIELDFKIDTAKIKKPFEDIGQFIQDALGFDDETFKAIEDAFGKLAQTIVKSWTDATQAQIDANDELQEDLDKRHERAQEALNTEIELEKLGHASNVELKQKELADIQAAEKKAQLEGIQLKKKAARQELILSELQAGASLVETIAKTFSANASLPFGAGIILSGVIIAGMLASFAAYKSKLRSADQSVALYTGGRPIDHLQPGESPKSDYMGRGKGHQIGGTNMVMSAYEMILKEKTTNANMPFWELANTGAFDNIDLMQLVANGGSQLPNITLETTNMRQIADNKENYMRNQDHTVMKKAIQIQTLQLINYFDNRPEYVSHEGKIVEFKKNNTIR